MSKMKNCPFCAYDGTKVERYSFVPMATASNHFEYRVTCLNCGACGPNDISKEQAIESWSIRRKVHPSDQADTDAYEDLRNATPEELLSAVTWFYRQESTISMAEAEEIVSLLRIGWELARPGGWAHVAPMWLRESKKVAALDAKEKDS
jgi:hypothetical protein